MVTTSEPDGIVWWTSSYSGNGEACVEVGCHTSNDENGDTTDRVLVRDIKDRALPALTFSAPAWRAFLTTLTL